MKLTADINIKKEIPFWRIGGLYFCNKKDLGKRINYSCKSMHYI
jgi:hypothetical protein